MGVGAFQNISFLQIGHKQNLAYELQFANPCSKAQPSTFKTL